MTTGVQSPFQIGTLKLQNRLIQGPLAGYSCAPFRKLIYQFSPPAYCVSEMISAHDLIYKHHDQSRFTSRAPEEKTLCYQIAGKNPAIMAAAAAKLESLGADLIDINCGCPKEKIRKKGLGSALLETSDLLVNIIHSIKQAIHIPLTVKIRIQGDRNKDLSITKAIEQAGADALIVHGRRWQDDYDTPCDFSQIGQIKQNIQIPVIANGDIATHEQLQHAITMSQCDGYMIARAGCGKPWLYEDLLEQKRSVRSTSERFRLFMTHVEALALLENEHIAALQSRSLLRYYFREELNKSHLQSLYSLIQLCEIENQLKQLLCLD
jgi:tRNA-dihydrouridine synthase B